VLQGQNDYNDSKAKFEQIKAETEKKAREVGEKAALSEVSKL